MFFSKTWTALLAAMATSFLAGMFLLAARASAPFGEADRAALRTVANAGVAALSADIQAAPVSLANALLREPRIDKALRSTGKNDAEPLTVTFVTAANETLLATFPQLSVALLGDNVSVLSQTGLYEPLFPLLWQNADFQTAQKEGLNAVFATVLDGRLFAVRIFAIGEARIAKYLVAMNPVDLGEGSFLRRVLGASYPAAVIRDRAVVGEPIGAAPGAVLLEVSESAKDRVPAAGASEAIEVGHGVDQRLGALGRIPGPVGPNNHAIYLAVASGNTAGFVEKDLAQVLKEAAHDDHLAQLNWAALALLFALSVALTLYLHFLEVNTPLRRLRAELEAVSKGTQHQIYFDIYPGIFGEVARAAAGLVDSLGNRNGRAPTGAQEGAGLGKRRTSTRQRTVGTGSQALPATGNHARPPTGNQARPPTGSHEPIEPPSPPASIPLPSYPQREAEGNVRFAGVRIPDDNFFDPFEDEAPTLRNIASEAPSAASLGLDLGDEQPPASQPPANAPTSSPRSSARTVIAFPALSNPTQREAQMHEIYQRFLETKQACGEPTESTTFERFLAKVEQNRAALMQQPGVKDVQFSVYIKDGKAALKAKVIREGTSA